VLIYNPTAGKLKRNNQRILHRTIEALSAAGLSVTTVPTTGPGTAAALARTAIEHGADLVLALGGDGTINEIANGVVGSDVPLALLPGGTANCLGIETGMGTDPVKAVKKLAGCVPRRIAAGRVTCHGVDRYFLAMVGVGLDAQIVSEVNPKIKKATGKFAYWVAGFKQMVKRVNVFEVRVGDAETKLCGFFLASRLRNYGGDLVIATTASLLSRTFDTLRFEGSNPLRYIGYMMGVLVRQHKKLPGVDSEAARTIEFNPLTNRVVYVQADGELIGTLPARVQICEDALTLLTPIGLADREARYVPASEAALVHPSEKAHG
jgi:YegS/Rv2252/BmrU family lipid kinase